jgi:hypothetical protein
MNESVKAKIEEDGKKNVFEKIWDSVLWDSITMLDLSKVKKKAWAFSLNERTIIRNKIYGFYYRQFQIFRSCKSSKIKSSALERVGPLGL